MSAMSSLLIRGAGALFIAGFAAFSGAKAQEAFFKGKTITIICFSGPGGPYDTYSRLLSRHLSRYIEGNPQVIVKYLTGAGGLLAARNLAEAAPRDGTTIGSISRTMIYEPLIGANAAKIDYSKFGWLGSMAQSTAIYVSWRTSKVKTAQDLLEHEMLVAGTGAASETTIVSSALNGILGTRIKLINGYSGGPAAMLALEAGEVDGGFPTLEALKTDRPDWIGSGKINLLFQARQIANPELPGVPVASVLAKTDLQRQSLDFLFPRDVIGRPFITPPGLPPERLKILQDAFNATTRDRELLAEAASMQQPIKLTRGEELAAVVGEAYATPTSIVDYVKQFVPKEQ